jgi:hypothetical protein
VPSSSELAVLRDIIKKYVQPVVNEMTSPTTLATMKEAMLYRRPIPGLPKCEVYAILNGRTYLLGLEMSYDLGATDKAYECMTATWKHQDNIRVVPANIMRRHHLDTCWQVRFFNLPVGQATVTHPTLEAL